MSKEWMLTPEEITKIISEYKEPNNSSMGYEKNIAKQQAIKLLKHLQDYLSSWSHGICIEDECNCPYSHIRKMLKQLGDGK